MISTQVDAELDVDGAIFRFVDTAGVRRKARVKDGTETQMVGRALKAAKLADVVLLVVDATSEVTDQDAMLSLFLHLLDGVEFPGHRRDVVPVTASARWRGGSRRLT